MPKRKRHDHDHDHHHSNSSSSSSASSPDPDPETDDPDAAVSSSPDQQPQNMTMTMAVPAATLTALESLEADVYRALKVAKGLERQRLGKRMHEPGCTKDRRNRLEREVAMLKVRLHHFFPGFSY